MPVAASEGLGAPLELGGLNACLAWLAMQEHAGRKEEQLPPAGLVVRASTGDGVLQPCPKREAEGAPKLGGSALERECSTAQLRGEIDVVEALEPEAHA